MEGSLLSFMAGTVSPLTDGVSLSKFAHSDICDARIRSHGPAEK